jgi:hypothetical protein
MTFKRFIFKITSKNSYNDIQRELLKLGYIWISSCPKIENSPSFPNLVSIITTDSGGILWCYEEDSWSWINNCEHKETTLEELI